MAGALSVLAGPLLAAPPHAGPLPGLPSSSADTKVAAQAPPGGGKGEKILRLRVRENGEGISGVSLSREVTGLLSQLLAYAGVRLVAGTSQEGARALRFEVYGPEQRDAGEREPCFPVEVRVTLNGGRDRWLTLPPNARPEKVSWDKLGKAWSFLAPIVVGWGAQILLSSEN